MNALSAAAVTIALAGFGLGGTRAARALAGPLRLPPFAVPAIALALAVSGFVVSVCVVARAAGRFDAGLVAAAVLGALFGGVSLAWAGTRTLGEGRASRRTLIGVGAATVLVLVVYGYVAAQYQMHDEHALFGHQSMVQQLRRDVYPLYYPPKPAEEARYHYGFDVFAGALARGYGLSTDAAIDLTCLLLVLCMTLAAAAIACDADAERGAPLAALAVHFGAGLAFVLLAGVDGRHPRCLVQYHHPTCGVELFPTQFLNVFQHPVSMGVPLFLVLVLLLPRLLTPTRGLAQDGLSRRQWLGLLFACVVVLAACAVGQFVYFALGGLAALAAWPVWAWARGRAGWPASWRGGLGLLAAGAAALGLAYMMGGMLAPNPSIDPSLVQPRAALGFPKQTPLSGILWHHAVNLGLGFLLVPVFAGAALWRRRPPVVMLLAFAVGGVLVAHLFDYARSWDIVKFPSAASFALSLLYVLVVDRALAAWPAPAAWLRRAGAVLLMGSGLLAAAWVVFPLQGEFRLYAPGKFARDPIVDDTIEWFLAHDYASEDVILAQGNIAQHLSLFGGLSVVAQDADLYYMGVRLSELYRQKRLVGQAQRTLDAEALDELGIRYLVFSDEELNNLGAPARRALEGSDRFEVVASFAGDRPGRRRRIWRVLDAPAAGAVSRPGAPR